MNEKISNNSKKNARCNTCTLKLVGIAYKRQPLFRLFREPLKISMRIFSWLYRIDPEEYEVRTPACHGCIRFYKVALKEKSKLFRWLNKIINPLFDKAIESIVSEDELRIARDYGKSATDGDLLPEESKKWMKGFKTGF
ncbi:MAG: nitroreductase [Candidatus Humimicrobiaceae bacterium]